MTGSSNKPLDYATPPKPSRRRLGVFVTLLALVFLLGVATPLVFYRLRASTYTAVGWVQVLPGPAVDTVITDSPGLSITPSRLTIVQRAGQPLPGTDGAIIARIGDITGGQTLLTIEDGDGQTLVHTVSVRERDVQRFNVGGASFEIELLELKNFLTGDDFAVFEIRRADAGATTAPARSEGEKIERLIDLVARSDGVIFIRNGDKHSAADASEHLRRKYNAARDRNLTARQFIEHIAGRSSMTGQEYRVALPDGREISSAEWLTARLREIESISPTRS